MANKVVTETTGERKRQNTPKVPAYFLSITVENVRCFGPQQTLNLSGGEGRPAQWTIILGNNGYGKTTLLQCLVALIPVKHPGYRLAPYCFGIQSMPKWTPFKHAPNLVAQLRATFCNGIRLTDSEKCKSVEGYYAEGEYEDGWWGANILDRDDIGNVTCFGYGASRHMGDTSLAEESEDSPIASLFSDNIELVNAEEWLLQADYAAHAAKGAHARRRAEKRRDEIIDVLVHLLPEVKAIRFFQITENELTPGVEVKTPYGWVSIKNLSLGYKTLIAWMVDFASRMFDLYPNSPNPLAEPAVVLVDEIDLHLHPKWQRTLMSYLSERFPNTQFIATAHSPLVVQAAQDANIVLLRREGDHVVIENNVEAVRNWRYDQILTSDLFGLESARPPQLDKLLAERTKILSKARLTKKDRGKLKELEDEIGSLPTGETPEDIEAMDIIRRAAERLKAKDAESSHDSGR